MTDKNDLELKHLGWKQVLASWTLAAVMLTALVLFSNIRHERSDQDQLASGDHEAPLASDTVRPGHGVSGSQSPATPLHAHGAPRAHGNVARRP